jgi:hypothetical protein
MKGGTAEYGNTADFEWWWEGETGGLWVKHFLENYMKWMVIGSLIASSRNMPNNSSDMK